MTETKYKTVQVAIKAAGEGDGLKEGQFTGYASVFGNKDSYGDVIVKGAFAESLKSYGETGAGIPVYWSHRMDDPSMNIGVTEEAKEDDHGLLVKVQLDLDTPTGAQVHRLIQQKRVKQMSFAYDVVKQAEVDGGPWEGGYTELQELKVHEVSVVPIGANQETELLAVKVGLGVERLKDAIDTAELGSLLADLRGTLEKMATIFEKSEDEEDGDEDQEKSNEEAGDGNSEDSTSGKAAATDPGSALAMLKLLDLEHTNTKE